MRNDRLPIIFVLLLTVWLCQGCPAPLPQGDDDTGAPKDACTGEVCPTPDVVKGEGIVDLDEVALEDIDTPEVKACDQCKVGEIKCDGTDGYFACEDDEGCLQWSSKSTDCGEQSLCVCGDDGAECGVTEGLECECEADCEGKECGADGCGEVCAVCDEGWDCNELNFKCIPFSCSDCDSICQPGDLECNGEKVSYCINVNADEDGCVECWLFDDVPEPCPGDQICDSDVSACVCSGGVAACGDECCATEKHVCNTAGNCCMPDCEGKECGSNDCGGLCATCEEGFYCSAEDTCSDVCESDCEVEGQKKCDGIGAYTICEKICDDCAIVDGSDEKGPCHQKATLSCEENEECQAGECICIPDCEGKICGSDGCADLCGECVEDFKKCNEAGDKCDCNCDDEPMGTMCDLDTGTEYASNCLGTCAGATDLVKGDCPTCQDGCTEEDLAPMEICGFDNATYPNFCELKCLIGDKDDCINLNNCPQVEHPGACKPDCCEDEGCSADYNPLCGSDGVTYCNKCALSVCGAQVDAEISCVGECVNAVACPDCAEECSPVCALHDGEKKNYGSSCMMDCQGAEWIWDGECCLDCPGFEQWVCAAEGETYKAHINDCFQVCQAPEQVFLYEIPELPNGEVWIGLCEDCKCDISNPEPVCGDDYFTYASACALQCAADSNPDNPPVGAVPKCPGACFVDDCQCDPETTGLPVPDQIGGEGIRGVCGADGNTYGSECHAAKYGTFVVSDSWCGTCAAVCSDDAYLPVCCDGVTYPYTCIADKCNDEIDPATMCFKGKCCKEEIDCDDENADTVDTCNNGVCENV